MPPTPDDPNTKCPDHLPRPFAFEDINFLDALLADHSSIQLILIDNADLLTNAGRRPTRHSLQQHLHRLHTLARQRELAIALFAPIPRLSSSPCRTAFLQSLYDACRRVYLLAPALPDEPSGIRHLFCLKNTLPTPAPTLLLPEHRSIPNPESRIQNASSPILLHQLGTPSDLTYPNYLLLSRRRPGPFPHALQQAILFLTTLLASGPLPIGGPKSPPPNSLRAQARLAGISYASLRRASEHMNLRIFRDAEHWYWQLPSSIPNPESRIQNSSPPPLPPIHDSAPASCAPSSDPSSSRPPSRLRDFAVAVREAPSRASSSSHSSLVTHHSSSPTHESPPSANPSVSPCLRGSVSSVASP